MISPKDFHPEKLTFEKFSPRVVSFCDFENLVKTKFDDDLHKALICNPQTSFDYRQVSQVFDNVLNKHAPLKEDWLEETLSSKEKTITRANTPEEHPDEGLPHSYSDS